MHCTDYSWRLIHTTKTFVHCYWGNYVHIFVTSEILRPKLKHTARMCPGFEIEATQKILICFLLFWHRLGSFRGPFGSHLGSLWGTFRCHFRCVAFFSLFEGSREGPCRTRWFFGKTRAHQRGLLRHFYAKTQPRGGPKWPSGASKVPSKKVAKVLYSI